MEKLHPVENNLGERLKEYRKSLGLTQGEVAEKLHISVAYVSKLEKGAGLPTFRIRETIEQYIAGGNEKSTQDNSGQTEKGGDEIMEFILSLEKTPELRLLISDLKSKSPDEVLEYIRGGRRALKGEKL